MLNILFMGTPDFAVESLDKLIKNKYNIVGVVTVPDKPKGRGMKLIPTEVKKYALDNNLPLYQPEKLRDNNEFENEIKKLNPDIICVVSYGKLIPKTLLELPKYGVVNVHPSLLPKYRGAAPIQWAILNGDKTTGVTTMYLNEEMDAGDIILQKEVEIDPNENSGELWNRLSKIGGELLVETLKNIENNNLKRIPQGDKFTLAPMLEKQMAKIDWENKTGEEIKNLVRGLNPIMGAYSTLNNKKIKFWKVLNISNEKFLEEHKDFKEYKDRFKNIDAGTIIYVDGKLGMYIKSKDSVILLLEMQGENSKRMSTPDFLRGNKIEVIDKFK